MTKRDDSVYLLDILEAIDLIFQHMNDMTDYEFSKNILVQDAVIRRFEVIGEAAANISVEFKSKYPQIEWKLMKDMRNKLTHEYFGISMNTVYSTIKRDLPILRENIQKLSH